jgi:hypothetical protein
MPQMLPGCRTAVAACASTAFDDVCKVSWQAEVAVFVVAEGSQYTIIRLRLVRRPCVMQFAWWFFDAHILVGSSLGHACESCCTVGLETQYKLGACPWTVVCLLLSGGSLQQCLILWPVLCS